MLLDAPAPPLLPATYPKIPLEKSSKEMEEFPANPPIQYRLLWIDRGQDGALRWEVRRMAKDPVCGMTVNEKNAKFTSQYAGKTYYFCSASCKSTFDKNPSRYAK